MRRLRVSVGLGLVVGLSLAIYFLKPVAGSERDLTLAGDATRGAYLIRLGGCVACHTDRKNEGAFLAGGQALKTPFGDFVPPNITSDEQAGIGSWSLEEFSNAMSNGEGPGLLNHYYPAFPYDNYTLMNDQDVVDLYAAIMEVEPVATPAPSHRVSFPFNIRAAMLGWKNLFFVPERFVPNPSRSKRWNRGNYLANGLAHCTACHTPRNALGGREDTRAFSGGSGTPGGKVPGITKDQLVAEGYDIASLVETLQTGFTPGFNVLGNAMGEMIEDSTAHWKDEDLVAISAYLLDED